MIIIDIYNRTECKVVKKLPSVNTIIEAEQALKKYCQDNNIHVVARESCGDSYWNYLSDKTEFDYTLV